MAFGNHVLSGARMSRRFGVEGRHFKARLQKCGRRYPIRDGIPVMLIEEAELPTEGQEKDEQ